MQKKKNVDQTSSMTMKTTARRQVLLLLHEVNATTTTWLASEVTDHRVTFLRILHRLASELSTNT